MQLTHRFQHGLSLVEMMVALAVGLLVISGALYLATASTVASRDNIRMSFLNQELRNTLNLMTRDLRRAGSWSASVDALRVSSLAGLTFGAVSGNGISLTLTYDSDEISEGLIDSVGPRVVGATLVYVESSNRYSAVITGYDAGSNTFTANLNATFPSTVLSGITGGSWGLSAPEPEVTASINSTNDCLLLSYDTDGSGILDNSERVGFRLDTTNKVIEMRQGGTGCSGTGWQSVTDDSAVEITDLAVTDLSPAVISGSSHNVTVREYSILITGRLKSDTAVTRSLRETIRVRNDLIS